MVKFDWKRAKELNSPQMFAFLEAVHNKPITEEDFVPMYRSVPKSSPKSSRSPSSAKYQYRNLKKKFGFFGGGA